MFTLVFVFFVLSQPDLSCETLRFMSPSWKFKVSPSQLLVLWVLSCLVINQKWPWRAVYERINKLNFFPSTSSKPTDVKPKMAEYLHDVTGQRCWRSQTLLLTSLSYEFIGWRNLCWGNWKWTFYDVHDIHIWWFRLLPRFTFFRREAGARSEEKF